MGEVDPKNRPDARDQARLDELDRAVHPVAVSQSQRLLAVLGGPGDQGFRVAGTEPHRVPRCDMEVDEGISGHGRGQQGGQQEGQ